MTAFFCPGKLGDACLQLPVARAYAKQHNTKVAIWLDSATCKPLAPLCESQDWVETVKLVGPSLHYACGGQPWDGNFTTQDHMDHEIVCLGFRHFPQRQITLETVANIPLSIELEWLREPTFHIRPPLSSFWRG